MDVSIVVVNWNTKSLLCDCLESILEQAGDVVDYEIIVVDNASSDGSADIVRSRFSDATLIVKQTNHGYAAAINDGIRVAQGRYVLVLNSDTLICDGAIAKTVGYADKHPEAAVVSCQVRERFWPEAFILHLGGGGHSSKKQKTKLRVQMQKSILLFFKKHYGIIHYALARLVLVVYTGLCYVTSALVLLGKGIAGQDVVHERKENRQCWFVFKYCLWGIEPQEGD